VMECLHGQLRDRGARVRAGVVFPPLTATNLAGDPAVMKDVEAMLRSHGVLATLVEPDQVAALVLDGIRRQRFFIRVGVTESTALFDGTISGEYLAWNQAVVRARPDAQLGDGTPDGYLW
jgi:hypothetical protein